ncbi:MAG TPA: cation:proton antiporter [Vicinamibacterales bacterium]|nr:cation:proton antiporter [Vicinamibacterales bacterium]
MLLIFGSAKLLSEICVRLRLPGIVGEILAGLLIGPSVLGWVTPNEFTGTMAELGVMFLLFRVGLEIEAEHLIEVGGTAVVVGALGVLVPLVSGWALGYAWGMPGREALFIGTALTATSVGITAQVLSAQGLLHRTAARIILGAAVVDDILALVLLGVVTGVSQGHVDTLELTLTALLAIALVVTIGHWGRRAASHFARHLEGHLSGGEPHFSIALVVLFALAAISARIGVAAIIGAFLAGVALADAAPRRVHDLTQGVGELLVPFFLVGIGLELRLEALASPQSLWLAVALIPVAILSKVAGCGLGAIRHGSKVAMSVGFGMVPRGEFCMVVAQAGLALQAISLTTFGVIVTMAVAAAIVAPPLITLAFRQTLATPEQA